MAGRRITKDEENLRHWHIWVGNAQKGTLETKAIHKVPRVFNSRAAANAAAKTADIVGRDNGSDLPPMVLECKDAYCRVARANRRNGGEV